MIQKSKTYFLIFFWCALLFRTFGSEMVFDEDDIYNCLRTMGCELGDQESFKEIYFSEVPEVREYIINYAYEKLGYDRNEPYNPDWSNYLKFACDIPDQEARKRYEEEIKVFGEFWSETCESGDIKTCKETDETAKMVTEMLTEKFGNGQCEVGAVKNIKKLNPLG